MQLMQQIEKMDTMSIKSKSKGKWFDLVLANVIAIMFVLLGFFIPVLSFALAFIVLSYMQVGVYGFVLKNYQGQSPDFESIFLPFGLILKTLCLKIIVLAGMLIWGLLLIVPGIIYGLNYSFAAFILFENPNLSCKEIFGKVKTNDHGQKVSNIFNGPRHDCPCLPGGVGWRGTLLPVRPFHERSNLFNCFAYRGACHNYACDCCPAAV